MSRFDQIYRSLILTKFFTKGWGNPENLRKLLDFRKKISDREICKHLVASDYPIHIDSEKEEKNYIIQEGHFKSPFIDYLPGVMPKEVEIAKFQVILPKTWPGKFKPMCLHLAGTGDHYFGRRRMLLAKPLLKEAGIGSILLENPYYGYRKPKQQMRSSLQNVSDLFVMGGALVLESLALFHWCEKQGYGPLGITGISMGGHMASLAATNWHKPLSLVPCLSWSTASAVFLQGVMSGAIPWELLHEQYRSDSVYEEEITKQIVSPEDNAKNLSYMLGKQFAKDYPDSLEDMVHCQHDLRLHTTKSHDKPSPTDNIHTQHAELHTGTDVQHLNNGANVHAHLHRGNHDTVHSLHIGSTTQQSHLHTSSVLLLPDSRKGRQGSYSIAAALRKRLQWSQRDSQSQSSRSQRSPKMSREAVDFMRGIMDECTHLGNFSCPVDTELIIIVQAEKDAYVPRDNVLSLQELWPGAELRFVDWGHVGAFLFKQDVFRAAIKDSFERQARKYYDTSLFS